jgi:transposase InsO family protein
LRIKKIRSDNGIEFKNSQIEVFLEDEGIKHEFSSPYTPQQNGVVERKNRTLLDMARTMLDEYKTVTLRVPQTTRNATELHFRRPYIKFRQHPLCKIA